VAHVESYVRERYDSRSLRIFRVILDKSKLEQKQIEDFSMIPSKECKALVYNMLNDGMLAISELSKTSDHAPSRTYYLFSVDVYQIVKRLAQNAYKAVGNLMVKRQQLVAENKSLLDKGHKINSRIESLQAQGADQAEIDYERSIISAEETAKLKSFSGHSDK
jgi:DNA-directed RNA polymerase III subunit RPC3